jgi:uncharacterized repeat protein (TIGR01451 family)
MRTVRVLQVGLLAALATTVLGVSSATALPGPGWAVDSVAEPSNLPPGGEGAYLIEVRNAGSEPTRPGEPVVVTDVLPEGFTTHVIEGPHCSVAGQVVRCEETGVVSPPECRKTEYGECGAGALQIVIYVSVNAKLSGPVTNRVTVSGGGAPEASASSMNLVSAAPAPFGSAHFDFYIDGLDGARDTQAGDHPYELTTTIDLNTVYAEQEADVPVDASAQSLRDVVVDLPLGFAGSALAAPQCSFRQLDSIAGCPRETVVGFIRTGPQESLGLVNSPIWNMVPDRGVPAEFAYRDLAGDHHIFYVHVVPTSAGYVLQVMNSEIPQVALGRIVVTFFGDPAQRDETPNAQTPFFTDPTDCSGVPPTATVWMDSWQHPGAFNADGTPDLEGPGWVQASSTSPAITGCDVMQFSPELFTQPTTSQADSPSGLEFEMKLPQTENASVPATPSLKTATVTLPEGMTVDPSAGSGLEGCSEAQIGWLGGTPRNFDAALPECPEASKIGTLDLETPLVPGVLAGELFLTRQSENPFGSVFGAYVVVHDPKLGVLIKIAGEFKADPHTGQITALFAENPQLPFSDLKLHFFGGPRAELATPQSCGTFTTTSVLEPWSAPDSGPNATPFSDMLIDEGCVGGFNPSFAAGSTNLQAGAYTPFVASFSRSDSDEDFGGLSVTLPPGLLADIGSAQECTDAQIHEAQAGSGGCPEASRVGTVTAFAGPGPNPLFVSGSAYLTGPYNGGAFGLAVVVPAVAGPFNFGNVVVRQSIRVDPLTAQVSDVSDPFPTVLDPTGANGQPAGVPIDLRRVDVEIDRPDFTFNPTNCSKLRVGGAVSSVKSESSTLAVPFQVTNCAALGFKPQFGVSTEGKTSRADGASLTATLSYPNVGGHSVLATGLANIAKVKVELPKQLPSRLSTLQKACTFKAFYANPASCPAPSKIGYATATTPLLPEELKGPAYFVSNGSAKFPELIVVLQGYGVTFDLHGETFINKEGITSSTFATVPDAPVGTFQLTLPEGPDSALAANGNLCGSKLAMPTEFLAQNGDIIHQSTPITVTGCKPAIRVVRHSSSGTRATLVVSVPEAGKLTLQGSGLTATSTSASKATNVTLKVKLTKQEAARLMRHHGRKRQVIARLKFTSKDGKTLTATTKVAIG